MLRNIVSALLFRLYPETEKRGADFTVMPEELYRGTGWTLAVYQGIGIGIQAPVRVVLVRPQATVAGAVVLDRGELEG